MSAQTTRIRLVRGSDHFFEAEAAMQNDSIGPVLVNRKTAADQRRHRRYEMKVPARFLCPGAQRNPQWHNGMSRDVSQKGAFVVSSFCPAVGTVMRIEVLLPSPRRDSIPVHMCGQGKVVRVESCGEPAHLSGFGVEVSHFSLLSGAKVAATRAASHPGVEYSIGGKAVVQDASAGSVEDAIELRFEKEGES